MSGLFTWLACQNGQICNPLSFATLETLLARAALNPGDSAVDLGCGNGAIAAWLASRRGLRVKAVERFEAVAALAKGAARQVKTPGKVEVLVADAAEVLARGDRYQLVCAVGAVNLAPAAAGADGLFAALAGSIEPGGYLLWGDPFWTGAPSPRIEAAFCGARYETREGGLAAAARAGLALVKDALAEPGDWDAYAARTLGAVAAWLTDHPDHPEAPLLRERLALLRALYEEEMRPRMGFATSLFRLDGG